MMLELTGDVRRHAHTAESEREAKDQNMKQAIQYNKYARHGGRQYHQNLTGSEEGKTEGCMKHGPKGREKSETARDWDPRTHEQTARVGTLGPITERAMPTAGKQSRRCPRATRGRNTRQCNSWRRQLIECTVRSIPRLLRRIKENYTLLLKI